jgi:hypothetical protein
LTARSDTAQSVAAVADMRRQFLGRRSIPTFLFTNCNA